MLKPAQVINKHAMSAIRSAVRRDKRAMRESLLEPKRTMIELPHDFRPAQPECHHAVKAQGRGMKACDRPSSLTPAGHLRQEVCGDCERAICCLWFPGISDWHKSQTRGHCWYGSGGRSSPLYPITAASACGIEAGRLCLKTPPKAFSGEWVHQVDYSWRVRLPRPRKMELSISSCQSTCYQSSLRRRNCPER
jgi:hypothetical protein